MGVCSVSLLVFRWFGDLVGWGLAYGYLNCSFGVASCLLVVVLIWLLVGGAVGCSYTVVMVTFVLCCWVVCVYVVDYVNSVVILVLCR